MRSARFLLAFLLLPLCGTILSAQPAVRERLTPRSFVSSVDVYFFETAVLPDSANHPELRVLVRLTYDLLDFRRTTERGGTLYRATPHLWIELLDSTGLTVRRVEWSDTVETTDYTLVSSRERMAAFERRMAVSPGRFRVSYIIEGVKPSTISRTTDPFVVSSFQGRVPAPGTPVVLRAINERNVRAAAVDGAVPFGAPLRMWVPLGGVSRPTRLEWSLLQPLQRGGLRSVAAGDASRFEEASLGPFATVGDDLEAPIVRATKPDGSPRRWGALLDASIDDVEPGRYLLALHTESGEGDRRDTVPLELAWVGMPLSLRSPDYAIRALEPIATDQQIDSILDIERDRRSAALRGWWRRFDPTPGTIYNEAMAEYYRRVDNAFFAYRTIGVSDGAVTDRGRIHILYGPPPEVRRETPTSGPPREVWVYPPPVGRRFTFVDERYDRNPRLVEIDPPLP